MQDVVIVPNEVAAELAGVTDGVLDSLRDRLGCSISLRGNKLTLDGDGERVAEARAVVDELVELVEGGHAIGPDTVGAVAAALDQAADIRDIFEDVVWRHRGKKIAPKTVVQKRYVDTIRSSTVTFGVGPAGTGKTYLAIALAVAALSEKQVGRLILTRPAVEAGERLGFLPGDMLAKVDPYMRPLFDALYDTMDPDRLTAYMERGTIEVAPLAFMRGRTLNDSFIILDEAQNTTPEQMQMFLTRLGFGSKMVVTGDITQIDLPREQASGLIQVRDILREVDSIGVVEFGHEDVVRHKLVQRIVEAYKRHAEETGTARKNRYETVRRGAADTAGPLPVTAAGKDPDSPARVRLELHARRRAGARHVGRARAAFSRVLAASSEARVSACRSSSPSCPAGPSGACRWSSTSHRTRSGPPSRSRARASTRWRSRASTRATRRASSTSALLSASSLRRRPL